MVLLSSTWRWFGITSIAAASDPRSPGSWSPRITRLRSAASKATELRPRPGIAAPYPKTFNFAGVGTYCTNLATACVYKCTPKACHNHSNLTALRRSCVVVHI
ncbi:uncharacterized protein ColSpa_11934 [Colletotrichum spaethianum]|uniref:Secreted protein n=1 Tax=Colletotrichum spaethianum TaxID=700344 RepID=A0AA37UTE3_9PEZI|nr:uncharacterized protein ColSpa_11934 [Colletotrichum spaethianum]GKT51753.1 hypothetical protein ColSpa_11934 [Colletotrichum spaethianum]